jgi:hypothetical protein
MMSRRRETLSGSFALASLLWERVEIDLGEMFASVPILPWSTLPRPRIVPTRVRVPWRGKREVKQVVARFLLWHVLPPRMGQACRVSEQEAYSLVQASAVARQVRGPIGVKRALAKYG